MDCQDLILRLESAGLRQQPTVREETISPKRRLETLQTLLAFCKIKLFCFIQSPTKSNWRKKRAEFISSLRAAKKAQKFLAEGGNVRDLPPPPPSDTSDYIQCQYCQRRYRHLHTSHSSQFYSSGSLRQWRTDTFPNVKISRVIKLGETNQGNKRLSIFYGSPLPIEEGLSKEKLVCKEEC